MAGAAPAQAATAVSLRVVAPATVTAGASFSLVVSARNPSGGVVSTYRGQVAFTSDDPRSPVLPGRYTFTAADAGTHTFAGVSLRGAGTRTITATDTGPTPIVGVGRSGPIAVSPAAVARLAITAPTTAVAGVPISATVFAKDRFFNVVPSYRGSVDLTSSDARMTVATPNHTFTAADKGGYTFTGVVLKSPSPPGRTLTATDGAIAALTGTTAPITVSPGPATHLAVSAPTTATRGVRFGFAVSALDSSGNLATGYRGHVSFTTSDTAPGVGFAPTSVTFTAAAAGIVRLTPPSGAVLKTAGPQTVRARDTSSPALAGSATVSVTTTVVSGATAFAWGQSDTGQLGDGTADVPGTHRSTPGPVTGSPGWRTVSAGGSHAAAIRTDGTLWTWGSNVVGQLGDGDHDTRTTPVQISTETDWTAVAAGSAFTLALRANGTLWGWGANGYGQLGNGTTSQRSLPTQVGTDSDWATMAAGGLHSLGVKTDGSLWAWGGNESAQLGLGSVSYYGIWAPVRVGTDSNWASVAAGVYHSDAIRTDGTLWSWGSNTKGQLGDGTVSDTLRMLPGRVGSQADWRSVSAAGQHTVALKTGGSLWGWGANDYGQVGDGTQALRTFPARIGEARLWTSASAGGEHTLAIASDGTLWAWGRNFEGEVGDGSSVTQRVLPVQIGSDVDWTQASGGGAFSVALRP